MSNVKGKGQRLIPEELLKYLEAYKEAHPDPTAGGGSNLEDIVDSQERKRFIEGDIVGRNPGEVGVMSFPYGKWSLSGTHLMLVLCVYLHSTATIPANARLCEYINLPDWVKAKLTALYASNLDYKSFFLFGSSNSYIKIRCIKQAETDIYFTVGEDFTPTVANSQFRIQFDFLIDAS